MKNLLFCLIAVTLIACNDENEQGTSPSVIHANAGADINVNHGVTVWLTGSVSGSGQLSTLWSQISGPMVEFTQTLDPPSITVTTPDVSYPTVLIFRLSVIDDKANLAIDDISITVTELGYTKYNATGLLPDSATDWDCVLWTRSLNGLVDYSLLYTTFSESENMINSIDNTYTWDDKEKGLAAINEANFCGFNDWVVISSDQPYTDNDYFRYHVESWVDWPELSETEGYIFLGNFYRPKPKESFYNVRYVRYM